MYCSALNAISNHYPDLETSSSLVIFVICPLFPCRFCEATCVVLLWACAHLQDTEIPDVIVILTGA